MLERIIEEIEFLRNNLNKQLDKDAESKKQIVARITAAKEGGDTSENADYSQALNELDGIDKSSDSIMEDLDSLSKLESDLKLEVNGELPKDIVRIYSLINVTVKDDNSGKSVSKNIFIIDFDINIDLCKDILFLSFHNETIHNLIGQSVGAVIKVNNTTVTVNSIENI